MASSSSPLAEGQARQPDTNGIGVFLKQNRDVDIAELDISGNVQRRWLHRPSEGKIVVRLIGRSISPCLSPFLDLFFLAFFFPLLLQFSFTSTGIRMKGVERRFMS